jgi:hypothetical protein
MQVVAFYQAMGQFVGTKLESQPQPQQPAKQAQQPVQSMPQILTRMPVECADVD